MPVPPNNPFTVTAQKPHILGIYVGDEYGNPVTADDLVSNLRLIRIERAAGSRRLDHAVFLYDLGAVGDRLVNLRTPASFSRQVEVRLMGLDGGGNIVTRGILFWGEITQSAVEIGPRTEQMLVTARIEHYHFGQTMRGYPVVSTFTGTAKLLEEDWVFNPERDGKIIGNRATDTIFEAPSDPDASGDYYPFSSPEANPEEDWTLCEALYTLCFKMNSSGPYIHNPILKFDDDTPITLLEDAPELRDLRLPRGRYLPSYLDRVLEPLGFSWCVDVVNEDSSGFTPAFVAMRVFKRGEGPHKSIFLQEPGSQLDLAVTNTERFGMELDIADLANVIRGQGSLQARQLAIPLYPGWPAVEDNLLASQLSRDGQNETEDGSADTPAFKDYPNAWRRWVANEGGQYSGLRAELTTSLIPNLSAHFRTYIPHKRKMHDQLWIDPATKKRRPPLLQWRRDEEAPWNDVPKTWNWRLAPDEISIYFNGQEIPLELQDVYTQTGEMPKLQIIGTVLGDSRLEAVAIRRAGSPNERDVELCLDLSDRFHDRTIVAYGDYSSINSYYTTEDTADIRDDYERMRIFLESVRSIEEAAVLELKIALHGIHFAYEIGDVLTGLVGRNFSFNRVEIGAENERYAQITRIVWDWEAQQTVLVVSDFRRADYES